MLLYTFPKWDTDLLIYINNKSHPWIDPFMIQISHYWSWFMVLIIMCILIFYKKKNKESIIAIGFMFAGILITLALNTLLKIIIQRPRPCESLIGEINILEDCGNAFSFFSAHSSSSFCMATFFLLYLKNRYYGFAAFLWAFMVAYSRLYVGKHYPLDVFIGTFFGITMGILCYFLFVHYGKPKLIDSKL